jgi:hypothetical protein
MNHVGQQSQFVQQLGRQGLGFVDDEHQAFAGRRFTGQKTLVERQSQSPFRPFGVRHLQFEEQMLQQRSTRANLGTGQQDNVHAMDELSGEQQACHGLAKPRPADDHSRSDPAVDASRCGPSSLLDATGWKITIDGRDSYKRPLAKAKVGLIHPAGPSTGASIEPRSYDGRQSRFGIGHGSR